MAYLTNRIQVCLSDKEYNLLQEEAKNNYRTVSTYVREILNKKLNGNSTNKEASDK